MRIPSWNVTKQEHARLAENVFLQTSSSSCFNEQFLLYTCTWLCFAALGDGGVKRSELVNWYLLEHEEEIGSEEELLARKMLVEKVIDRLIEHVSLQLKTNRQTRD